MPVRCGFFCVITRMLREVNSMAAFVLMVLLLLVGFLVIVYGLFKWVINEDEGDETDDRGS